VVQLDELAGTAWGTATATVQCTVCLGGISGSEEVCLSMARSAIHCSCGGGLSAANGDGCVAAEGDTTVEEGTTGQGRERGEDAARKDV